MEPIGFFSATPVRVHVYALTVEPVIVLYVIKSANNSGCWHEVEGESATGVREDLNRVVDILKSHGYDLDRESMAVTHSQPQESEQKQEPDSGTEGAAVHGRELPAAHAVLPDDRGGARRRAKKGK